MSAYYERLPLREPPNPRILTEEVRKRARIGKIHWEGDIDAIPDHCFYKKVIQGYVANIVEYERTGFGLILLGKLGSGKTTLGALILRQALARGARCLAIRCSNMVDMLLSTERHKLANGAPLMEGLSNVNFLLLDDFEAEDKVWRARKIESVLRVRYDEGLPTIITTNMARPEFFKIDWLKSMLYDRYEGVDVKGINWRKAPPHAPEP